MYNKASVIIIGTGDETMNLSRNSDLYKFCDRYISPLFVGGIPNNLCTLLWKMTLTVVGLFCVGLIFGGVVVFGLIGYYLLFTYGLVDPNSIFLTAAGLLTVILIVVAVVGFIVYQQERKDRGEPVTLPPFLSETVLPIIREAHRGIKEKYCPFITWVD